MKRVPLVAAVVGVALAAVGVWSATGARAASFGWTAYSPLSSEAYVVPVGPPWWALTLIVLGSVLAGVAGTLLVLRRR